MMYPFQAVHSLTSCDRVYSDRTDRQEIERFYCQVLLNRTGP